MKIDFLWIMKHFWFLGEKAVALKCEATGDWEWLGTGDVKCLFFRFQVEFYIETWWKDFAHNGTQESWIYVAINIEA